MRDWGTGETRAGPCLLLTHQLMTPDGKVSLLIAEDDPHIRYLLEVAATRTGCFSSIQAVPDGEAAMLAVRNAAPADHPELIVTDLSMPRMTGLDLIRALKSDESTRHIPIAVITSSDVPNDRDDVLAAGATAFARKPQGLEPLTQLLGELRNTCCVADVAR